MICPLMQVCGNFVLKERSIDFIHFKGAAVFFFFLHKKEVETISFVYFTSSILEEVVGQIRALTANSTNILGKKERSTPRRL